MVVAAISIVFGTFVGIISLIFMTNIAWCADACVLLCEFHCSEEYIIKFSRISKTQINQIQETFKFFHWNNFLFIILNKFSFTRHQKFQKNETNDESACQKQAIKHKGLGDRQAQRKQIWYRLDRFQFSNNDKCLPF